MRTAALAAFAAMSIAPMAEAQEPKRMMMQDATLLSVTAEGRVSEKPDMATLTAGVMTDARTAEAALSENAKKMTSVMAAIRGAGVADKDMQTAGLNVSPQYAYEEGRAPRVTGYQAMAMVQIKVRKIEQVGRVVDAVVANGSNQLHGVIFGLAEPDVALDRARGDAVKKARARAEIYANAAGLKVQRIVSIAEAGAPVQGPIPVMMEARAAGGAPTPVAEGELDLSAPVSVVFELK
jgi:uncharacterized protein YggE